MRRLGILIIAAVLVSATSAFACEVKVESPVKCQSVVRVLTSAPEIVEVVDLALDMVEAEVIELGELTDEIAPAGDFSFAYSVGSAEEAPHVEEPKSSGCGDGVFATIVTALGKLALKAIATLIQHLV